MQFLPLFGFLFLAHTALSSARVLVSLYALHLHSSPMTIGILIGLFALFPMLLAVTMGRWVDRTGPYWPMLFGSAFLLLGTILPFVFPQIGVLYLTAMLMGSGHVAIQVSGQQIIGSLSTGATRAGNFGMLSVSYSMSSLSGPLIAGFMIDGAGHRATFLLLFGLLVGGFIIHVSRRIKMPPLKIHATPVRQGSAMNLLLDPAVRDIYLVGILMVIAWEMYTFVLPIHGTQLGFSASTIGIIIACFSSATLVVRVVMPFIYRHFKEWQILRFALLWAALCYLTFPLIHGAPAFMIFSFMLGLALGCGQPNLLSLLHNAAPPGRGGEALGVRLTIGNATQVALPLMFGAAGAAVGMTPLFLALAVTIASGARLAHRQIKPVTNNKT